MEGCRPHAADLARGMNFSTQLTELWTQIRSEDMRAGHEVTRREQATSMKAGHSTRHARLTMQQTSRSLPRSPSDQGRHSLSDLETQTAREAEATRTRPFAWAAESMVFVRR